MLSRADFITKTPTEHLIMALTSLKLPLNLPGDCADNFIHLVMVFSQNSVTFLLKFFIKIQKQVL